MYALFCIFIDLFNNAVSSSGSFMPLKRGVDGGKCEWSNLGYCPGIFRFLEGAGVIYFADIFGKTVSQSMPYSMFRVSLR